MTMMMTNSQFGLEDMEALLWGPSSPMADPMGSLQFHPDQEEHQEGGGTSREGDTSPEALGDLDWMAERMDLSEFDLESLIGSCSPPEESPSSTEDLLASLDCPMELDSLPLPTLSTPALSS
uniref:Cyclic AMP-dependent transcription factor ATF-4-like n=1 Tax=Seriola lalandi dorsalis TaxID=1841481 RepID=A0A3B4WPY4_SERLL